MTVLLGVDAGTTSLKTVAYAPDGTVRARASAPTPSAAPHGGWSEQDMTETWGRTAATVREVVGALDGRDGGDVGAVGVTGQGGGCWLVDADGDPVRNAVRWNDGRAAGYVEAWREDGTADELFARTGDGAFSGMALPLLRWLEAHDPEAVRDASTLLACKDWIRYRLTGDLASDLSDASLMHLDVESGSFDRSIPDLLGVETAGRLEPRLRAPTAVAGTVTGQAAEATGLPAGTPVVAGAMDVVATAFGGGAVAPGDASAILGTTLQAQVLTDRPRIDPPPVGYTLALGVDGMGLRAMGAMTGTPNLDWAREHVAEDPDFEAVEAAARSVPPGADGVLYLPFLNEAGEKAPFVDPDARAGFAGLAPDHTRAHLLRAVYEGVALAARDCFEHLPRSGTPGTVRVGGGGTRSAFWRGLLADCLDARVVVPTGTELGARGAAMLAAVGVGVHPDLDAAARAMTGVEATADPGGDRPGAYDDLYRYYRAAVEGLRDAWSRRAAVAADH